MSKKTVIPAGYRLTISSWENDGDHRRDIIKDGLSDKEVSFYVDVAKLFYSCHNHRGPVGFGNMYDPSDEELQKAFDASKQVFLKHWDMFVSIYDDITKEELDDPEGAAVYDITGDLHYELFGASEFRFRVLDNIKVEFIPVAIEIQDVTSQFK